MLEIVFVISFFLSIFIMIKAIDDGLRIYNWISILLFFFTMAGSVYITVPGEDDYYTEGAVVFICVGLIFVNLIYIIMTYWEEIQYDKKTKKFRFGLQ